MDRCASRANHRISASRRPEHYCIGRLRRLAFAIRLNVPTLTNARTSYPRACPINLQPSQVSSIATRQSAGISLRACLSRVTKQCLDCSTRRRAATLLEQPIGLLRRHRALVLQIERGERDARTLIAIPSDLAVQAKVKFPKDAYGPPQPW